MLTKSKKFEQLELFPETMPIFPVLDSLQEVINLAESQLPITDKNALVAILMTFQNTLIKVIHEKNQY